MPATASPAVRPSAFVVPMPEDPRWYQIACLSGLLAYGVTFLEFDVTPLRAVAIVATAQLTQYAGSRWKQIPFDPLSAMISALSLCLLLRANHLPVLMGAAVIAIGSKFVLRLGSKHVFNPTNLGIAIAVVLTGDAWISPGQWGNQATLAFLFACLGGFVVHRSDRMDVTFATLLFWSGIVIGRSMWLGEPMTIPLHRLQSGSILLFSFFMISDPKTTPDHRAGRILFAALVCAFAYYWQFKLFNNSGLVWGLVLISPLVPLIDHLLPGPRYTWPGGKQPVPEAAPITTHEALAAK